MCSGVGALSGVSSGRLALGGSSSGTSSCGRLALGGGSSCGSGGVMDVVVSRNSGTGTDHLLESAHDVAADEEEEENVLEGVVIGSIDVAHLKEELSPVSAS